jgi:hypothetical protein
MQYSHSDGKCSFRDSNWLFTDYKSEAWARIHGKKGRKEINIHKQTVRQRLCDLDKPPYKIHFNDVRRRWLRSVKAKGHSMTCLSRQRGELQPICNIGTGRGWVVGTTPWLLYLRERPSIICTGDWMGIEAGLDVHRNLVPIGIQSVQPIARSYTNYVIPAAYKV